MAKPFTVLVLFYILLGRVVTVRKFSHRLIDLMSHRYHRGGGSFVFLAFLRF